MLLDQSKFVIKSQSKVFSSKKSFEILDESNKPLGSAQDVTGFLPSLFGSTTVEVRDATSNAVLFSVARSGVLLKKDQVLDGKGAVVGRYKAKMFSLSGGFHMYDAEGKHLGEIQGKMFKSEYKFVTPDKKTEMGSVSRTWGGLAKSLFTGGGTFGVQISPGFAADSRAKMLILGATIALETIFKKKGSKGSEDAGGGGGDDE